MKTPEVFTTPGLFYDNETWTIRSQDKRHITASGMRFLTTAGYILKTKLNNNRRTQQVINNNLNFKEFCNSDVL